MNTFYFKFDKHFRNYLKQILLRCDLLADLSYFRFGNISTFGLIFSIIWVFKSVYSSKLALSIQFKLILHWFIQYLQCIVFIGVFRICVKFICISVCLLHISIFKRKSLQVKVVVCALVYLSVFVSRENSDISWIFTKFRSLKAFKHIYWL